MSTFVRPDHRDIDLPGTHVSFLTTIPVVVLGVWAWFALATARHAATILVFSETRNDDSFTLFEPGSPSPEVYPPPHLTEKSTLILLLVAPCAAALAFAAYRSFRPGPAVRACATALVVGAVAMAGGLVAWSGPTDIRCTANMDMGSITGNWNVTWDVVECPPAVEAGYDQQLSGQVDRAGAVAIIGGAVTVLISVGLLVHRAASRSRSGRSQSAAAAAGDAPETTGPAKAGRPQDLTLLPPPPPSPVSTVRGSPAVTLMFGIVACAFVGSAWVALLTGHGWWGLLLGPPGGLFGLLAVALPSDHHSDPGFRCGLLALGAVVTGSTVAVLSTSV